MQEELFRYNWQVRNEWIEWCEEIPYEELIRKRIGGMGSFLHTLYHVIDCEQLWINQMWNKPVITTDLRAITQLDEVKSYDVATRTRTELFLHELANSWGTNRILEVSKRNGEILRFPFEKVMSHIITHEMHHIGQLSIWAREMGRVPVNSDLLIRDF
ncbi:DinB family protein [Sporosarcina sp. Te-1]|uniref:DinB family protein n=1 Tax=Sporosarcina sp. Te-1 TaxID=2818390 RepID=UPI001A9CBFC7|nr:DinB family protein [Sporosarcina sp. Te-1]QTD43183.1 DinB family protein [Sporosarcina sp. Te-1]